MKAGTLFLVAYALVAQAQPHGHVHHRHQEVEQMERRGAGVTHAVYLDANGNPTATSVLGGPTAASVPEGGSKPKPKGSSKPKAQAGAMQVKEYTPKKHYTGNYGISYDPNHDDGTYKTTAEITDDFRKIRAAGFKHVRSYRTDWGQVNHMLDACSETGLKLFPSTSEVNDLDTEIPAIVDAAHGRWHLIDSVGVGNEDVNSGTASASDVIAAVNQARGMLRGAGYEGPVVHAEVFNQYLANKDLCQAGDYVAANCHAFFDPNTDASQAAQFVMTQQHNVESACGGKETRITESGWPSAGNSIGAAVPSPENQQTVVNGLKKLFRGKAITIFMAFNEAYKATDSGDPTEQYWGILS